MLTRLVVQNYRCLEDIDAPLGLLTAFVGPNGSGKTSLLRCLSCLFGDWWPSLRSFRVPQDFARFDAKLPIEITGYFDPPYIHSDALGKEHEVGAIRLSCRQYKRRGKWGEVGDLHADLQPLGTDGEVPVVAATPPRKGMKPSFRPMPVTGDLRDHARVLFIDHRRNLAQHLPGLRGSVLGKLLEPARRDFDREADFKSAYEAALTILRTETVRQIEEKIQETAKRMLGFLGRHASKDLEVGFGFADPANPFNSLRLEYREAGASMPGEELGLGIQSAMVIGIFEAFRQLGGGIGTVVIEEPEMYLHPQAQRYFYRLLCQMADEQTCQVIYATHSPIFADVNRFESLRLVRRDTGKCSTLSHIDESDSAPLQEERKRQKLAGRFDPTRNEVLFASKALLVEGQADRTAALLVAEKLGQDPDAEGVAIVDCGGKNAIPLVARVCAALEIPFAVLHDEDIWPEEGAKKPEKRRAENATAKEENKRIADAGGGAAMVFVAAPTLEELLGVGRSATDKPQKVTEALRALAIEDVPQPLLDAVKAVLPPERSEPAEPPRLVNSP